jgi:hypothetical protein
MIGFVPQGSVSTVVIEKNRDGRRLPDFALEPSWDNGAFTLTYSSNVPNKGHRMTPTAMKVVSFFSELRAKDRESASQKEIVRALGGSRGTVLDAIQLCVDAGLIHDTGLKDGNSPIYKHGRGADRPANKTISRDPDSEPDGSAVE